MTPVDGDIHEAWLVSSRDGLDRSVGVLTLSLPLPSQGDCASLTDALFSQYMVLHALHFRYSTLTHSTYCAALCLRPSLPYQILVSPTIHNPNPHPNPNSNPNPMNHT